MGGEVKEENGRGRNRRRTESESGEGEEEEGFDLQWPIRSICRRSRRKGDENRGGRRKNAIRLDYASNTTTNETVIKTNPWFHNIFRTWRWSQIPTVSLLHKCVDDVDIHTS